MDYQEIYKIIEEIVDEQARTSVGIMCKKVECLEEEDSLKPTLFKSLIKETIYEQSRALKRLLRAYFMPKTVFTSKSKEKK